MVSESRERVGVGLLLGKGKKLMGRKKWIKDLRGKTASWQKAGRADAGLKWKGESENEEGAPVFFWSQEEMKVGTSLETSL